MYSSESTVRRTGSYLYEEFVPTDGTDVKVCNFANTVIPRLSRVYVPESPAISENTLSRNRIG